MNSLSYTIKRWWFGAVLGKCSLCKKYICQDYPIPGGGIGNKPYFEDFRVKKGWLPE